MSSQISYRPLETYREFRECLDIQRETWGPDARDHVPASLLSVAVKVGGVAAGAFGSPGGGEGMLGFVFGLAGWRDGDRAHWSHMLAVRPPCRGRGIGRRLKWFQRELLLEDGVGTAFWTFDPLVARNAHLNLNLLGARVDEFVVDMYGPRGGGTLQVGGATDRFVVRWELESPGVEERLAGDGPPPPEVPANTLSLDPLEVEGPDDFPDVSPVGLAIPARAVALDRDDPDRGRTWRRGLRRALRHYLDRGYRVAGFRPAPEEDRGHYVMRRD